MEIEKVIHELVMQTSSKIVMLVADGLGGLPLLPDGKTELESANMPNLSKIIAHCSVGLLEPISPGITPGSGPAHLGLFGYDPIQANIGRGVLSALGVNFNLRHGDLCARVNFCTIDKTGKISDRRAGRISTDENKRICAKILANIKLPHGIELYLVTEKEHRVALILRGMKFYEFLSDTDPQKEGLEPLPVTACDPSAGKTTVDLLNNIADQVKQILADEPKANMILLRGFAEFQKYTTMADKFKLKCLALATYPMYRGLAKLIGMDVNWDIASAKEQMDELEKQWNNYDFFFIHIKGTDSSGEDGDFQRKVKVIESIDEMIPSILKLKPDVFMFTCDHSTPAKMKGHSWHKIPALLYASNCRPDRISKFDEYSCAKGSLNGLYSKDLMPLALAHAGKLMKFGA